MPNYFVVGLSHVDFHPAATISRGPLAGKTVVMSLGSGVEMSKDPDNPVERRVFGYFPSEGEARQAVEENRGDLNEGGLYEYVVIEEVPPGIHPDTREVQWYRNVVTLPAKPGDRVRGRYEPIDKPPTSGSAINFSIG